jgi:hypothetical protein
MTLLSPVSVDSFSPGPVSEEAMQKVALTMNARV